MIFVMTVLIAGWNSLAIALLVQRFRYLLLKPSTVILLMHIVFIEWPSVFAYEAFAGSLRMPEHFLLLAHGFPAVGVLVSLCTPLRPFRRAYEYLPGASVPAPSRYGFFRPMLKTLLVSIVGLYLLYVPLTRTGLWAILFSPDQSDQLREEGMKLLGNPVVQYSYACLCWSIAPLLCAVLTVDALTAVREKKYSRLLSAALWILGASLASGLPGTRIGIFVPLAAAIGALLLVRRLRLRFSVICWAVALFFVIPTMLTVMRNGAVMDIDRLEFYLMESIVPRVFSGPVKTTYWHMEYVQNYGFFGVAGIPKLARLLGIESVDVPNVIGLHNMGNAISSVSCVTSYVFAFYACFGLASLPLSWVGLALVDWIIATAARHVPSHLVAPFFAAILLSSAKFVDTSYLTVFVSDGLLCTIALCAMLLPPARHPCLFVRMRSELA